MLEYARTHHIQTSRRGRVPAQTKVVPLYQQIYEDIKSSIESGKYKEGDKLPTEQELSEKYGVSRITIRRAIGDLCANEYLLSRQGVGTFVSHTHIFRQIRRSGARVQTFTDICRENGMTAGAHLLERQIVPARDEETQFLGLEEPRLLIYTKRVRTANGMPVYEENVFVPYLEFRQLMEVPLDDVSIFGVLEQISGRRITTHSRMTVEAVAASAAQSELLHVAKGAPLLYMNCFFNDQDGRPLAIGRQYYVGSRYAFDV